MFTSRVLKFQSTSYLSLCIHSIKSSFKYHISFYLFDKAPGSNIYQISSHMFNPKHLPPTDKLEWRIRFKVLKYKSRICTLKVSDFEFGYLIGQKPLRVVIRNCGKKLIKFRLLFIVPFNAVWRQHHWRVQNLFRNRVQYLFCYGFLDCRGSDCRPNSYTRSGVLYNNII